jgi:HTH-type transcriptional regulator / antitoxin HipB
MVHNMIINLPSDLGSIIRDGRKRMGLTQKELALMVGSQQRTISIIENDPSNTALKKLVRICKVLGLSLKVDLQVNPQSNNEIDW